MVGLGHTARAAASRLLALVVLVAFGAATHAPLARAEPAPSNDGAPESPELEELASRQIDKLTAGRDLIRTRPEAPLLDGAWSGVLQILSLATSARLEGPQPRGLLAHEATRVLYGSTWTAMLAIESFIVASLGGGSFDFLAQASYRADWIVATTLPACPSPVSLGGCGLGAGGFGSLSMRPKGSRVRFEAGGGWIEQRVSHDGRRTISESMWVLTPFAATLAVKTPPAALAAFLEAGPGAYFGMHTAHLHPASTAPGFPRAPWHELFPIELGVGPGGRARTGLTFARRLTLETELVVAVLPVGTRQRTIEDELFPVVGSRGVPSFRMLSLGAAWDDPTEPLRFGVSLFAAELSGRPFSRLGHRGGMVRLEFPLRVTGDP
jgi:hypothetical protein